MKVALIQMAIREGQPKQNTKTVLAVYAVLRVLSPPMDTLFSNFSSILKRKNRKNV